MKTLTFRQLGILLLPFLTLSVLVPFVYGMTVLDAEDLGGGCTGYTASVDCSELVGSHGVSVYQVVGTVVFYQVGCSDNTWSAAEVISGGCEAPAVDEPAACYRESSCGTNQTEGVAVEGVCDAPEPSEDGCTQQQQESCQTFYDSDSCAGVIDRHTEVFGSQETLFGYPSTYTEGSVSWSQQMCTDAYGNETWHWPEITGGGCSAPIVQDPPPPEQACSLPWGGSLSSGQSTTAYEASSVPYGSSCSSESRYCSDGSLSGSYQHGDCAVETAPPTCDNGAVNYAACNQCSSGQAWNGSSCVACSNGGCSGAGGSSSNPLGSLVCNNGATNPYACNVFVPIVGITLAPSAIQGVAVPMSYSSTHATSCSSPSLPSVSGPSGTLSNISSILSPGNNTIGVSCTGPGGSTTSYASINLLVPSVDIMASPMRVRSGNPSTISWSTVDVSSCSVTGPNLSSSALSGNEPVSITTQSLFSITCDGLSDSVTVNIIPIFQEF